MSMQTETRRAIGTSRHTRTAEQQFSLVVLSAFQVPRRDRVAVAGILNAGTLPPPGTNVLIEVDGQRAVSAQIAGGAAFDVQPPRLSFLLKGVTADDITEGARITCAPAAATVG